MKLKTKRKSKQKSRKFINRLSKIDRRLWLLIIAVLAGAGVYAYGQVFGDKLAQTARNKADSYMQAIKDCDQDKLNEIKYGADIDPVITPEAKEDFEKNCKEFTGYTFLELMNQPISEEKLKEFDASIDFNDARVYSAYYRFMTTKTATPLVVQLLVIHSEDSWMVLPGPGPITEAQYNSAKRSLE